MQLRHLSVKEQLFHIDLVLLFGQIGSSLDLGYTYGTYVLTYLDKDNRQQQAKGTYLTIWKKTVPAVGNG